ncbi:CLUMA_CG020555, isoform A [Clunio marinus]|uniref:CLUMA_CG020555, isoform A n=1 Tax=Clunio marinus TaxID=568069 RepID=A0A1J1J7Y6_9DIPT|nr:CLUMA_CG020555, isoform A [Clunio marinus]
MMLGFDVKQRQNVLLMALKLFTAFAIMVIAIGRKFIGKFPTLSGSSQKIFRKPNKVEGTKMLERFSDNQQLALSVMLTWRDKFH